MLRLHPAALLLQRLHANMYPPPSIQSAGSGTIAPIYSVCTLLQGDMMGRAQISLSGAAMRFKRVSCPGTQLVVRWTTSSVPSTQLPDQTMLGGWPVYTPKHAPLPIPAVQSGLGARHPSQPSAAGMLWRPSLTLSALDA